MNAAQQIVQRFTNAMVPRPKVVGKAIRRLPVEIKAEIFSYLDGTQDFQALGRVNHAWREVALSAPVLRQHLQQNGLDVSRPRALLRDVRNLVVAPERMARVNYQLNVLAEDDFDAMQAASLAVPLRVPAGQFDVLRYSPAGAWAITYGWAQQTEEVRLWNLTDPTDTGKVLIEDLNVSDFAVSNGAKTVLIHAWQRDYAFLLRGSEHEGICLFRGNRDAASGPPVIRQVAVSRTGRWGFLDRGCNSDEGGLTLWDFRNKPIGRVLKKAPWELSPLKDALFFNAEESSIVTRRDRREEYYALNFGLPVIPREEERGVRKVREQSSILTHLKAWAAAMKRSGAVSSTSETA